MAVDQFEEIFTACRDDEERVTFVERLVARARDRRSVVIVAIRADFYGRCAAYPDLARLLAANHVLVGPMRRDELRSAIENPTRQAGLAVDPELVDALVTDVDGEPGALPLLSTTLLELWRHRDGRRLRLSAYEHSGGVHGAVARLAESAYERLDDEQREIARRMLLRLAGEGEGDAVVRRRVDLDELEDGGDGAAAEVLSVLTESRLVTLGEGQVEVAHEALLREWPRLRGWLEEDVQGRRLHRHLSVAAHEWDVRGRDAGELYRGARLASVLDWAAGHEGELNAAERAFVEESRAATDRSHRRLRAILAGVGVLLVLAVVAGIVALGERGKAREEATAADAQRLGARALVEPALDRSLLLARQGVALDDTVETRGSLLAALLQSPAAIGVLRPTGQSVESVALSPDGSTLAVGDDFGNLVFYDARTRRRLHMVEQADASAGPDDSGVYALAFSPDGRTLAVAQGARFDQEVTALDTRTYRVVARLDIPRDRQVDALRYLPDGQALDAVVIDQPWAELLRLDARTGQRLGAPVRIGVGRRSPPSFTLRANVTVTADGRRVVVPGTDETIVRDAESLRIVRRLPARLGEATALALSPDDGTLAVGRDDGSLRLLDLRSGAIRTATGSRTAAIALIAFAPDGRTAVSGDIEGGVTRWDVRSAEPVETLVGHRAELSSFAFTSDGDTLYSASFDRSVFAWDLDGARRLGRPFRAGSDNFRNPRYALSSDGRLLAHGQENGAVSVVDARTLVRRTEFPVSTVNDSAILGTAFVPGSHLLVVGNADGFLALADADTGRVKAPARTPWLGVHARHQRRRAAARHRRRQSRPALLVAAGRPPARQPAAPRAACQRRAAEPRRPPGRGGAGRQARGLGRPQPAPGAQARFRPGARHRGLLARRPTDRAGQRRRRPGVVDRGLDADHAPVWRTGRSDLVGHDQPRQPHAGHERPRRHRAAMGHRERKAGRRAARHAGTHRHRSVHPRRRRRDRRLRHRTGVPLGHPPRVARTPGMPDRQPDPDARGVGRVPARARL